MARPVDYRKSRGSKGVHTEETSRCLAARRTKAGNRPPLIAIVARLTPGCKRRRSQRRTEGRQTQGKTTASMPPVTRAK